MVPVAQFLLIGERMENDMPDNLPVPREPVSTKKPFYWFMNRIGDIYVWESAESGLMCTRDVNQFWRSLPLFIVSDGES